MKSFAFQLALISLVLLVFWLIVGHAKTPVGLDGYYYVLQVDTLLSTRHVYYPTLTPLVFYIQGALSKLIGSTVIAIKVSICAATLGLFFALRYCLAGDDDRSWVPSFCAGIFLATGPFALFEAEFVKNLWGIMFAMIALGQFTTFDRTHERHTLVLAFCTLACSIATHKTTAALSAFLLIYWLSCRFLASRGHTSEEVLPVLRRLVYMVLTADLVSAVAYLTVWNGSVRTNNTLGAELSITLMPLGVAGLSMVWLAIFTVASKSSGCLSNRRGSAFFVVLASLMAVVVCTASYLRLAAPLDETLDRLCLMFLVVSGPFCAYWLLRQAGSVSKRITIALAIASVAVLSFVDRPRTGTAISAKYDAFMPSCSVCDHFTSRNVVVIAPHGVDFLITAKYGLRATHLLPKQRTRDLYWFVWNSDRDLFNEACLENANGACIDVGAGELIKDNLFRRPGVQGTPETILFVPRNMPPPPKGDYYPTEFEQF